MRTGRRLERRAVWSAHQISVCVVRNCSGTLFRYIERNCSHFTKTGINKFVSLRAFIMKKILWKMEKMPPAEIVGFE